MVNSNLVKTHICAECEAPLVERWNPATSQREIKCGQNKAHVGFKHWKEGKSELERKGRQMVSDNKHMELTHYSGSLALEKAEAELILRTIWPDAPKEEVFKAALICKQYGLNPLMKHIYLIKYDRRDKAKQVNGVWQKGAIVGEDWSIQIGIGATRMIARRSGAYSYEDDTPRLMTEQEQIKILGAVEPDKFWAITKLRSKDGMSAQAYGNWPRDTAVKGSEKGNTPQNMAFIRSERAALDKLFPEKLPAGVGVIAQEYEDTPKVNVVTGEVREMLPESPNQSTSDSPAPKVENPTPKQAEAPPKGHQGQEMTNEAQLKLVLELGHKLPGFKGKSDDDIIRSVCTSIRAEDWNQAKALDIAGIIANWENYLKPKPKSTAPGQSKIMPLDSGEAF